MEPENTVLQYQSSPTPKETAVEKGSRGLWVVSLVCYGLGGLMLLVLLWAIGNIGRPGVSFHVLVAGKVDRLSSTAAKASAFVEGFFWLVAWLGFSSLGAWSALRIKRGSRIAYWVGIVWCGLFLLMAAFVFVASIPGTLSGLTGSESMIVVNCGAQMFLGGFTFGLWRVERWLWIARRR